MNENPVLAVPMDRQNVTLRLDTGAILEGEIFLEYVPDISSVHQRITAFLESGNAFFPLKRVNGNTEFVNRKKVQTLEVKCPERPDARYCESRIMNTIPVTAIFSNGDTISGELMAEVPQEKARLSDCLNLPSTFLEVKTDSTIYYINKEALQKILYRDKV